MIFKVKPRDFKPKFEVVGCFCSNGDKILFLLRHSSKDYGNKWNLPAGKVEVGESLEEAVIREVEEETGIKLSINDLKEKRTYFDRYPEYDYFFHTFKAEIEKKEVKIKDGEVADHGWFTPDQALKLDLVPDEDYCIKDAYKI